MPPESAVALQGAPSPSPRDGAGESPLGTSPGQVEHLSTGSWLPTRCPCPLPAQVRQLFEEIVVFAIAFGCTMPVCLSGVQYTWEKVEEMHPRVFSQDLLPSWYLPEVRADPSGGKSRGLT